MALSKISNSITDRLRSKSPASLDFTIQRYQRVGEVARVLLHIPHVFSANETEVAKAIVRKLPGLRLLSNSLSKSNAANLYTAFVKASREVASASEAANFVEISANVFKDTADNVWNREMIDGVPYFVCTETADIDELLNATRPSHIQTASLSVPLGEKYSAGMPIVVYNPNNELSEFAIGIDGMTAYVPSTDSIRAIPEGLVVACVEEGTFPAVEIETANKATILDYMRRVYGHNAEYYRKMAELINRYLHI